MKVEPLTHFERFVASAQARPRRIVLPEATDPRILEAAARLLRQSIAAVSLVGDPDTIARAARAGGHNIEGAELIDISARREQLAEILLALRKHKGMDERQAYEQIAEPLTFACTLVRAGMAHGCVAGARYPTAQVVRSALQIVGKHPEHALVSSFFIMQCNRSFHPFPGAVLFADCALAIEPDSEQLAHIAAATADNAVRLLGVRPRVAMLSFSTAGSAAHPLVDKVVAATQVAQQLRPDYDFFGEVQLDAALVDEILAQKAPQFSSENKTNVFIFPSLEAGNIGYKLVQRFAAAEALGPILQGLNQPVNDLSRVVAVRKMSLK